jgi:regulatory protein
MKSFDPSDRLAIRRQALMRLARREHSRGELEAWLTERSCEAAPVAEVLDELEAKGLLDDQRYLDHFVLTQADRGQGPDTIARKLLMRGFGSNRTGPCIETGYDWVARAEEVRRKKFGPGIPTGYAEIQLQARFLRNRGFTVTQIRAVLDTQALDECPAEDEEC